MNLLISPDFVATAKQSHFWALREVVVWELEEKGACDGSVLQLRHCGCECARLKAW